MVKVGGIRTTSVPFESTTRYAWTFGGMELWSQQQNDTSLSWIRWPRRRFCFHAPKDGDGGDDSGDGEGGGNGEGHSGSGGRHKVEAATILWWGSNTLTIWWRWARLLMTNLINVILINISSGGGNHSCADSTDSLFYRIQMSFKTDTYKRQSWATRETQSSVPFSAFQEVGDGDEEKWRWALIWSGRRETTHFASFCPWMGLLWWGAPRYTIPYHEDDDYEDYCHGDGWCG